MRSSGLRRAAWLVSLLLPLAGTVSALETVRILGPDEIARPVFLTAPVGDERLFVVERAGRIRIYQQGALLPTPFLDITASVTEGGAFGEGGLLGLAFPADYTTRGFFYVYYTSPPVSPGALTSRISRFQVSSNPNQADPASELNFFSFTQPFANHNGGTLAVRDGYLYFGAGDGGSQDDPGDRSQDNANVFGQMVRWSLSGSLPGPLEPYAYGLRNPFRFSFDRLLGDLYIGDVGQGDREEIDIQAAEDDSFRNYGWDVMEGSLCKGPDPGELPCFDPSFTGPAWEYAHPPGNSLCDASVTGGVVYRGQISAIQGHYFFADFCSDDIWSFRWDGDPVLPSEVVDRTSELAPAPGGGELDSIVAFGEDGDGEMYIVDLDDEVYAVLPEPGLGPMAALVALAGCARRRRLVRACPGRVRDSWGPARVGSCPGAVGGECQR